MKTVKPRSFIFYYCSICVLIGCIETAMNQKMFEQNHPPIKPIRTITIKPAPIEPVSYTEAKGDPEQCPSQENVDEAIDNCNEFIDHTQKLVVAIQNEGDAEESKLTTKRNHWQNELSALNTQISCRLKGCDLLLGASGYPVFPGLPLALENLKRAGRWLEFSVAAAESGNLIDAVDYINYARKATSQASKLVNGRVRPNARTAIVRLPNRLKKVALVSHNQG